ncbi:hypothetical protein RGQ13_18155 [Thalassotalea psychrophila]|uniref:Transposase n=1 Tax=Thalassotalea psychrophila TaxID=3065647 RepID=A0ABY9TW72_9GAMM|nr:hypothetical protein RGQ13_18155 [Colwelliaceae bacterium SQ149]
MVKPTFTHQVIFRLLSSFEKKEGTAKDFFKENNINNPTFYYLRKKYGKMSEDQIEKMCRLEKENRRLRDDNVKLLQISNAATDFIKSEFPSSKVRRELAKRFYNLKQCGQTCICELFSIKWNSFHR